MPNRLNPISSLQSPHSCIPKRMTSSIIPMLSNLANIQTSAGRCFRKSSGASRSVGNHSTYSPRSEGTSKRRDSLPLDTSSRNCSGSDKHPTGASFSGTRLLTWSPRHLYILTCSVLAANLNYAPCRGLEKLSKRTTCVDAWNMKWRSCPSNWLLLRKRSRYVNTELAASGCINARFRLTAIENPTPLPAEGRFRARRD